MSLASRCGTLIERARMYKRARQFFEERNILEVDTPILSKAAPIDAFIEVMKVDMGEGQIGYLHTSPEYGLKKLLAKGSGDIYQLSHVFRANEESPLHMPEFTMLEWYRVGMTFANFIEETFDFIHIFLPNLPCEILTYREAFLKFAQIDYLKDELFTHTAHFSKDSNNWDRDTQLNLLFSHLVEPQLGKDKLTAIINYPESQAALAKTDYDEQKTLVAKRFEIYFNGIELGNGFEELTNSKEQKERLIHENKKRVSLGKQSLPLDEEFIEAVGKLPACCGVAVGFDRLMMLYSQQLATNPVI